MEKIYRYGFFVLMALVILVFVFKDESSGDNLYIETLESKIERLNMKNAYLDAQNSNIVADIEVKMDSIANLKSEVKRVEYKKTLMKRYYENKINAIDKLNVYELDSAFAARYR